MGTHGIWYGNTIYKIHALGAICGFWTGSVELVCIRIHSHGGGNYCMLPRMQRNKFRGPYVVGSGDFKKLLMSIWTLHVNQCSCSVNINTLYHMHRLPCSCQGDTEWPVSCKLCGFQPARKITKRIKQMLRVIQMHAYRFGTSIHVQHCRKRARMTNALSRMS